MVNLLDVFWNWIFFDSCYTAVLGVRFRSYITWSPNLARLNRDAKSSGWNFHMSCAHLGFFQCYRLAKHWIIPILCHWPRTVGWYFFATELQDTTIRFTTNLALTPPSNEVFDGFAFEENNGFRPRNRSEKLHLDSFSLAFHLQTLEDFFEFDHPR